MNKIHLLLTVSVSMYMGMPTLHAIAAGDRPALRGGKGHDLSQPVAVPKEVTPSRVHTRENLIMRLKEMIPALKDVKKEFDRDSIDGYARILDQAIDADVGRTDAFRDANAGLYYVVESTLHGLWGFDKPDDIEVAFYVEQIKKLNQRRGGKDTDTFIQIMSWFLDYVKACQIIGREMSKPHENRNAAVIKKGNISLITAQTSMDEIDGMDAFVDKHGRPAIERSFAITIESAQTLLRKQQLL